jgi:pimeloyl-ACP methyl ester carboxylesterase
MVEDLEAVVDASGLDDFALLGISGGGPVAISYAARHPERINNLVLYGSYARGRRNRDLTAYAGLPPMQRIPPMDAMLIMEPPPFSIM